MLEGTQAINGGRWSEPTRRPVGLPLKHFPFLGPALGQDRLLKAPDGDPDSSGLSLTQPSFVRTQRGLEQVTSLSGPPFPYLSPVFLSKGRRGAGEEYPFPVSHLRNSCPLERTLWLRNFPPGHQLPFCFLIEPLLLPPFCLPPLPLPTGSLLPLGTGHRSLQPGRPGQVGKAAGRWGCPLELRTSSSSLGMVVKGQFWAWTSILSLGGRGGGKGGLQ